MKRSLVDHLRGIPRIYLWLLTVMLAMILTELIVSAMSQLIQGRITQDYLLTGLVASVFVASVVSGLTFYFLGKIAAIDQRNAQLNAIIQGFPVPIVLSDSSHKVVMINSAFTETFGYGIDELPDLKSLEALIVADADGGKMTVFSEGDYRPAEVEICTKFGERRVVVASLIPLHWHTQTGRLAVLYDVTERSRHLRTVYDAHNLLRSVIETIPLRVFWKDCDSRFLGCNTLFARDSGFESPDDLVGKTDFDMVWRNEAELYRADDRQIIVDGQPKTWFEEPQTGPDGREKWLRTAKVPLKDRLGSTMGILGIYEDVSSRKRVENELWLTKSIIDKSKTAFFRLSDTGRVQYANEAACRSLGYSLDELVTMYPWDFDPDFPKDAWPAVWDTLLREGSVNLETRHRHRDGTTFPVEITGHLISHEGNRFSFTFAQNITERKRLETDLKIAATAFESQEGMIVTDANAMILKINQSFTRITGFTPDECVGRKMNILKSGIHDSQFYSAMWQSIIETGSWQGEIWNRRKNGEIFPEWLTISAVKDDHGKVTHYVGAMIDITLRKAIEEKVQHLAHHDALTDLPNRILLVDRLNQALAVARRNKGHVAILYIDLDKFKPVNDDLGHGIGDELLKQVAGRLLSCVRRESDTVCRLGGDEFVVLLAKVDADRDASIVSQTIVDAIDEPFLIDDHRIRISASVGIAVFPDHGLDALQLMKNADKALYHAKGEGRGRFRFFESTRESC